MKAESRNFDRHEWICKQITITVPNIALTLNQLREMNGYPIWVVSLINEKPGEWCILRVVEMSKTWFISCAGSEQVFGDKETYGETWLAYAYPPPAEIEYTDYGIDRIRELIDADLEGRCIVLNSGYTETVGGEALRKAMYECFMTNNEITRYTADAIAEKIVRDAEDNHIDRNKWKSCWTCENDICRTCVNAGADPLGDPCYKCSQDGRQEQYEPANFCPDCGRPLTNEAWDMLEKRIKQNQTRGI